MKCALLFASFAATSASRLVGTPVDTVVSLIEGLKKKVEEDGQNELKAYDEYACWCEDTLGTKSKDISDAKTSIDETQTLITKLGAELATYASDIKQLKKDVAQNKASQKEATEMRNKEYKSYDNEKTEAEQCIGALEAAIKVLTGAGSTKTKFLETLQEAQLLGTLGSLRGVIRVSALEKKVSNKDLDVVRQFVERPDDFIGTGSRKEVMSAAQIGQNPFGDYAPQSGQIQGILKGMYDAFTADLEKDNAQEANKQKSHEELMATKKQEEKTLEATLQRSEKDSAEKTKKLADSKSSLNDLKEQLEADETFFEQTKESCKSKAAAWAERVRLRAEELQGMTTAIGILSSDEAKKTFKSATTTFLQLSLEAKTSQANQAFAKLQTLSKKFGGLALAEVAVAVKMGGHFDKVIHMIENMVIKLKEEEKEDIAHRDRCEAKRDTNKKTMEDLTFKIDKLKDKLGRWADESKELSTKVKTTQEKIEKSEATIKEMKKIRDKEFKDFSQASKDDLAAIALLEKAIASMSKFYTSNNKLFLQVDKPPKTWEDEYGGRKSESTGILAILTMIKEDLEKEVKTGGQGDAASQIQFRNDLNALEDTLDAQEQSKADAEKELAELKRRTEYRNEDKDDANTDLDGEKDLKKAIAKDCDWIETDFKKRADKRKLEVAGLNEAKNFLAGAVVLPPKM